MAGILKIDFNSLPVAGESFTINLRYLNNTGTYSPVALRFDFVTTRTRSYQVPISNTQDGLAQGFVMATNIDYGNTGGTGNIEAKLVDNLTSVESTAASAEVAVHNESWEFVSITGSTYFISYIVENQPIETPKTVKFVGYDYALSTCDTPVAIFELTGGTGLYKAYIDGVLVVDSKASPLRISVDRNKQSIGSFSFTDSAGVTIGTLGFRTPYRISADRIDISITYTAQGATVSVNVLFVSDYILPLSYSLDGVTYSEENVFTGQSQGNYTMYVKDAFGCVTFKSFIVDGYSSTTEVICEVSDINPIRYSAVENGKKNRYNTLSHEQLKNIAYPFIHHFTDNDTPVTQLKTNAKYLNVFALACDGSTHPLTPVQRSSHLGQTFKSTALKFSTEDNRLGIYFGVVDVLDPLTGTVIENKDYGYQVPHAFNKVGALVNLSGVGLVAVDNVTYNEDYEAFVLEFNISYTIANPVAVTLEASYNIQNYEIYEFIIPVSQLPDNFNVVIEAGNSVNDIKYTFISEGIERVVDSENLAEIIYWHTKNLGGMNYATGVAHTLRLYGTLSRLSDSQTVEGYDGDTERYNTDIEVFDGEEFIFNYLSEEMARKLRLILTHDRLFINGVLYRLGDDVPEINSRFTTNVCELTTILRKGGDLTETFSKDLIEALPGEGGDESTYGLEQAIAAAKGKALILWKK